MNRLTSAILATAAFAFVNPAHATLQIAFQSGASTFACQDGTPCDLDGAASNLLLLNTVVGNIRIEGTFAASVANRPDLSVSNLTITNLSRTSSESLDMAVGDTGFSGPVGTIRSSASATFNSDPGGSASLSFWGDHANLQPAANAFDLPGSNLFSVFRSVVTSPDSVSGTHDSPFLALLPFSLSEGAVLTLAPGASITGFNESMAAIPETPTWAMLVGGFALIGLACMNRRRGDVAALQ